MDSDGSPLALPEGYSLQAFETLDGTNAEALRRMTAEDAGPGDVFIADVQTAGRGRQGRHWSSLSGNLHATIVADAPADRNPAQLAFVAGLAAFDAIGAVAPTAKLSLKWPNDILCDGRKLAGILIEAGEGGYAVGVGINLVAAPPDGDLRRPATNLQEQTGSSISARDMLGRLCMAFAEWHERWTTQGFEPLRAVWLASAHGIGDTIAASVGGVPVSGRFEGLDEDGALLLVDEAGQSRAISAGDVIFPGDG